MHPITKLINFIELAYNDAPSERFQLLREADGYPMIMDNVNRIRVVIGVEEIEIRKYGLDGPLLHDIIVPWSVFNTEQKNRLIDLIETVEDLDPEIQESLNDIFKGTF